MSSMSVLYAQTITLFSRVQAGHGSPVMWHPTVIDGVHLITDHASSWNVNGGRTNDNAKLHIRYVPVNGEAIVHCRDLQHQGQLLMKKWCPVKAWRRTPDPDTCLSFAYGDNDDYDFFIEGVHDAFLAPVSDDAFGRNGLYAYLNTLYDNVFAITSVHKCDLLPHFVIGAR